MKHTNTATISLEEYEKLKKLQEYSDKNYIRVENYSFLDSTIKYCCENDVIENIIKRHEEYIIKKNEYISKQDEYIKELNIKISEFNNSSFFQKIKYLFKRINNEQH